MDFEQYKQYIIHTANEYSKVIKRKLVNDLVDKGVAMKVAQESLFNSVNLFNIDENEQLIKCINERKEAIKLFENWEYIKNYKYSVMFSITGFDKSIIDTLKENGTVKTFSDSVDDVEGLSSVVGIPYVKEVNGLLFFKFNLKSEAIHPRTGAEMFLKYPILMVVFPEENMLEIRYDSINTFFTSVLSG